MLCPFEWIVWFERTQYLCSCIDCANRMCLLGTYLHLLCVDQQFEASTKLQGKIYKIRIDIFDKICYNHSGKRLKTDLNLLDGNNLQVS